MSFDATGPLGISISCDLEFVVVVVVVVVVDILTLICCGLVLVWYV